MSRRLIIPAGLLGLGAVVVLLHLVPGLDRSFVEQQIRNGLHVIGFGGVAAIVYRFVPATGPAKPILAVLSAVAIGVCAESTQHLSGGEFDITDLYRDLAGTVLVVAGIASWSYARRPGAGTFLGMASRGLAVLLLAGVFVPLVYWSGILAAAKRQSPVLHDFDRHWSRHFVAAINAEATIAGDEGHGHVAVTLSRRPRSGVTLAVATRDWRHAEALEFDARVSNGPAMTVTVHINDGKHMGRFRDTDAGTLVVGETTATHIVPVAEVLAAAGGTDDPGDIRQLVLLGRDRNQGAVLHIDNLALR